jgi:hypothetical protein
MTDQPSAMIDIPSFVAGYSRADQPSIAFAWNGKHAADFVDGNQKFRWEVIGHCLAHPEATAPPLLADLFLADADWSREAWGAPQHFGKLGALLLERGGEEALVPFSQGFSSSFDTFGACHIMTLPSYVLARLREATALALAAEQDDAATKRLSACRELFAKLTDGTARKGWATVAPNTPVSGIRVMRPGWLHKLRAKLASAFGRDAG